MNRINFDCGVVRCVPRPLWTGLWAVALILVGSAAAGQALSVNYRGTASLPGSTTTDQNSQSFAFAGLSGLTWAGGSTYWAVMDNSDKLVKLNVTFNANASINAVSVVGGLTLPETRDNEGIAFTNAARGSVWVSDETSPGMGLREYSLSNGALLQTVAVPSVYQQARGNFGLESLSAGKTAAGGVWTANEEALTVDGSLSTTTQGSVVRLQQMNGSGTGLVAGPQYAYVTAPIHRSITPDASSRSGLSDLVALPDGRLLALERSFAYAGGLDLGVSYQNRLYLVDTSAATDISALTAGLTGETYTASSKELLWSKTSGLFEANRIGNLEGLTLGPQLANGNHVLLGIVDWPGSGSSDSISANRLVAFELVGTIPEPTSALLLGFLALPLIARRRRSGLAVN